MKKMEVLTKSNILNYFKNVIKCRQNKKVQIEKMKFELAHLIEENPKLLKNIQQQEKSIIHLLNQLEIEKEFGKRKLNDQELNIYWSVKKEIEKMGNEGVNQ